MSIKNIASSAVTFAAVASLVACGGGRDQSDAGTTIDAGNNGCVGICDDGGTNNPDGGGNNPDGGMFDAGTCEQFPTPTGGAVLPGTPDLGEITTPHDLRYGTGPDGGFVQFGSHVILEGVQVIAVAYIDPTPSGASSTTSEFWVVDPAQPDTGIWVHLRASDSAYTPAVGDILTIDGFFTTESQTFSPFARRYTIANYFKSAGSAENRPVTVTKTGTADLPPDNVVDAGCAFNAFDGLVRGEQNEEPFAGARIHINGPLTITNAKPVPLTRLEIVDGTPNILGYNGFEVSGGILVNDQATHDAADGGCDWAAVVNDGGTVTFPNGISGVWDTYAAAPCAKSAGGTCTGSSYQRSYVPNSNGLLPDAGFHPFYTFALYPQDCSDVQGMAQ